MHVPDGFLDVPTSLATGAIAVGGVGLALRRAEGEIRRSGPALPGLVAAFVFATQMVNFPVGAGTSGHLIGGALAAALVGPWTAVLVMSVVLVVQALLFADGGLTALGTNIALMAIVAVAVGSLVTQALLRVLPKRPASVVPAATAGAFVSVPAAAGAFALLYAVGGEVAIPLPALATAMIGWHVVIGIGEAVITAAIVGAVVATRPDLVWAARGLRQDLLLVDSDGRHTLVPVESTRPGERRGAAPSRDARGFLTVGALGTLVIAGLLSLLASSHPDGLEFVGEQLGFAGAGEGSATAGSPLADYALSGVPQAWGTSVAGIVGVLVTIALALTLAALAARRRSRVAPERTDTIDDPLGATATGRGE